MIATRLHHLIELVAGDAPKLASPHHYVIDDTLVDMMVRTDVQDSIQAMTDAGICRLPYPEVLVEFQIDIARRFVALREAEGVIRARTAALYPSMATVATYEPAVTVSAGVVKVSDGCQGNDAAAIGLAVAMALLLLNTRGIEKDKIAPGKLNKARLARGKAAIPDHTVLRVGTVYTREGGEDRVAGRRAPRVHMRAGHCRQQACGANWSDHRTVYIPPVLVNYEPGAAVPGPRQRVVAR